MKFVATCLKDNFYSLYLKRLPKKISNKEIGIANDNIIIIGVNLTRYNMEIFKTAKEIQREKKLSSVYTVNGIVNVKILKGGTAYVIRNKQELNQLLSYESTAPAANPNVNEHQQQQQKQNVQQHKQINQQQQYTSTSATTPANSNDEQSRQQHQHHQHTPMNANYT